MGFKEVIEWFKQHEEAEMLKDETVIESILIDFISKVGSEIIEDVSYYDSLLNCFVKLYIKVKKTKEGRILDEILEESGINYSASVHNAIYHLLGNELDYSSFRIEPTLLPGFNNVEIKGKEHLLHTKVGKVRLYDATSIFKNHPSSKIFELPLHHQCYARTYDFVKMNSDSSVAVISYMPNHFAGGHYHAYIERENDIIDIAANAYYASKEEATKVLTGKILGKYSFEEIEKFYKPFQDEEFNDRYKLYALTAFSASKKI